MDSWKFCDVIRIFRMDWNVFLEIKKKEKKKQNWKDSSVFSFEI